ncbi:MAG: LCP family protein [Ornithinimicrobium sp.]
MSHRTPGTGDEWSSAEFDDPSNPLRPANRLAPGPAGSAKSIRRTYVLTALGTVIPGAGLAMTRRRAWGIALFCAATFTLFAVFLFVLSRGAEASALDLGARPQLLQRLGILASVAVLIWMASVAWTALTARPRILSSGQRFGLVAFTGLMCLLLAAPTALGWRYVNAHSDAVERIFVGREDGSPSPLATPDLEQEDPWADTPRVNVLLLGSDGSDERDGIRTDTMLIASIDTKTGDSILFGIPRNLEKVPIPDDNPLSELWPNGYNCGDQCLMNSIWTQAVGFAEARPELYTDDSNPGLTATREVLGAVIDQPIDYSVIVNLEGFQDLVDAMGGVEINVQERLPMGGRTGTNSEGRPILIPGSESGYLEPGVQQLTGYEAMWYARSRITTDDFSRMRRQRCVVAAVVDQVNPMTMIQRYPTIVGVAGDNIKADISAEELPAWAELVSRVQGASIKSLPFTIENTDVADPNYDRLQKMVREAIDPPAPKTAKTDPSTTTKKPAVEEPAPTEDEPEDELSDVGAVC